MADLTPGPAGERPPPRKRPTLKTIAEMTGFSLSTVSLSLRGGEYLRDETRRKVAEAARLLGYVPDRAGVRLRTGKTNVITLVLDGVDDSIDFARHMILGIGHAVRGTRYHLTVMPEFKRTASMESIRYILDGHAADGVIVTHTSPLDPRVQLLMEHQFPFVTHGRTDLMPPHPFHDFHSELFAELAVERLAAKGCGSLLLVIGDDRTNNYQNIVREFERTAARLGMRAAVVDNMTVGMSSHDVRSFGQQLAARRNRPDGIVCISEMRAVAMISGLQAGGAVLGRDIELVSKQTSDLLPTLYPLIDTIAEDVYAAGQELTRLLLRRIAGEPAASLQTLSEPTVHWRS
jgi:LacI family transcriptional regulator